MLTNFDSEEKVKILRRKLNYEGEKISILENMRILRKNKVWGKKGEFWKMKILREKVNFLEKINPEFWELKFFLCGHNPLL